MAVTASEHRLHQGEDGTRGTGSAPRWGWIRTHPLLAFFLVAFGITWPPWLIGAATSHGLISVEIPLLFVIGGVGPGVAAVLVVRALDGMAGVDAMWRALLRWRVPLLWAGAAVGIPIGIRVAAAGVGGDVDIVWSSPLRQ